MKRLSLLVVVAFVVFACASLPKAPSADEAAEIERLLALLNDRSINDREWSNARDLLVRYDEAALPSLLRELRRCNEDNRYPITNIIMRLPSSNASTALAAAIRGENDPRVRTNLVELLSRRPDVAAATALGEIARDHPDPWLRAEILLALMKPGCPMPNAPMSPAERERLLDDPMIRPTTHRAVLQWDFMFKQLSIRFLSLPREPHDRAAVVTFAVRNGSTYPVSLDPNRFFVLTGNAFYERTCVDDDCMAAVAVKCAFPGASGPAILLSPGESVDGIVPLGDVFSPDDQPWALTLNADDPRFPSPCTTAEPIGDGGYRWTVTADIGLPLYFILAYVPRHASGSPNIADMVYASPPVYY